MRRAGAWQILALEQHLAAGDAPGRLRHEPHDGERGYALAAAGFADDAEGSAALERQIDAVDRVHLAALGGEVVRKSRTSSRLLVACNLFFDDRSVADAPGTRFARAAFQVGHEALVRLVVEPGELGERIDVVVDTQIEIRILLGRIDEERGRLPSALVAAGRLTGLQRFNQPFRKCFLEPR